MNIELDPNDPNQSCLMAGGDCIVEISGEAAEAIQKKAKGYGNRIGVAVDQAAKATGIHPHFMWWALFRPKQWPPMRKDQKNRLHLAQQVYEASGAKRPSSLSPFTGNPGWTMPESDSDIRKSFEVLTNAIMNEIQKPLIRDWVGIQNAAVKDIEEKCEEVFGEPCSRNQATDLLYGDLTRMAVYNRMPGRYPNLVPALLNL